MSATPDDQKSQAAATEPWMRGTHTELDVLLRGVIHALELAEEDVERWAAPLDDAQMFDRIDGLPHVAFHLRHMVRSLDRLLTYAEDRSLSVTQLAALRSEQQTEQQDGNAASVLAEFRSGMALAKTSIRTFLPSSFAEPRGIGRKKLPTTVAGLLIHMAEHTQRHSGQMVTTCKIVTSRWGRGGKVN